MKIRSTIDLYYAIPATVFLAVLSSYVRFFQLAIYDDFNVTGAYSIFFFLFYNCNSFLLLANKHLLTYFVTQNDQYLYSVDQNKSSW